MKNKQQKWLLIILVVIALNAGIWFLGISPTSTAIDTVKRQTAVATQKETQLQQRLKVLREIDVESLEAEQIAQLVEIPNLGLLREFLTELEATALEMDNVLASVSLQTPTLVDVFESLTISMTMTGQYASLYDYIKYLETHSRLIFVDNFSLSGQEDTMALNLQIILFAEDFDTYTPHQAPGRANPFEAR